MTPTKVMAEYRNIAEIKPNPKNPRVIKDDKFKKLVESLRTFPEMLDKRPLICVTDPVDGLIFPLGGNMRLKAAQKLKMAKLPVEMADDWTEEQRQEFIIKDNVGFGEWNYEELSADWDVEQLAEWGLDVPQWSKGLEVNEMDDVDITEDFDPVGVSAGLQRVVFIFDGPDEAESYLKNLNVDFKKMNMAWQVNLSTQSI